MTANFAASACFPNFDRVLVRCREIKAAPIDRSESDIADELLVEWYPWSAMYRPHLGAPRIAPYCKDSRTSRQYDEASDLAHDRIYQNKMKAIEWCVDALLPELAAAIGIEMRNRQAKAKVWSSGGDRTYAEALAVIVPIMARRGLFD